MAKSSIYKIIPLCLISDIASAGAWLQPEGKFEIITQFEHNSLHYNDTDYKANINAKAKEFGLHFYDLLIQYGANKNATIGTKFRWFDYKGFAEYYPEDYDNFNYAKQIAYSENNYYQESENHLLKADFFLQNELWSNDHSIFSVQTNFTIYPNNIDTRYAAIGVKLLYGQNFSFINKDHYINIELGFDRILDELTNRNKMVNLGLTLGIRATKKITAIFQTFSDFYLASRENYHIGQFSLVYHYSKNLSWQTGYSTNLNKRNSYVTQSYITGIWIKF